MHTDICVFYCPNKKWYVYTCSPKINLSTRLVGAPSALQSSRSDFKVHLFYDTSTPQDWNNPWMISNSTDFGKSARLFFIFHIQSGWILCQDYRENMPISCARDGFEKVCLSVWHTRGYFLCWFLLLFCSLSVSETGKEISQLKTKETVTFLLTIIYFPFFYFILLLLPTWFSW